MKVLITGSAIDAVNELAVRCARAGFNVNGALASFHIILDLDDDPSTPAIVVDGVDCVFEAAVVNHIAHITSAPVTLQRAGGNLSDEVIHVTFDSENAESVVTGVYRALVGERKAIGDPIRNGVEKSFFKRVIAWLKSFFS